MAKQADRRVFETGNDDIELGKLREMATIASIYHKNRDKFQKNPTLTHVVHASLHLSQFIVIVVIITFHHVHHYVIGRLREKDKSVPEVPEEMNPIFYIYPTCLLMSIVFATLWLFSSICMRKPEIVMGGCFAAAFLMLLIGIMEMKHADMYLDLTVIMDSDLLRHPVFIHNFTMCLLSIFCMDLYLIQAWVTFDYWMSIRKQRNIRDMSRIHQPLEPERKVNIREWKGKEKPGELDVLPSLENFPSLSEIPVERILVSHHIHFNNFQIHPYSSTIFYHNTNSNNAIIPMPGDN